MAGHAAPPSRSPAPGGASSRARDSSTSTARTFDQGQAMAARHWRCAGAKRRPLTSMAPSRVLAGRPHRGPAGRGCADAGRRPRAARPSSDRISAKDLADRRPDRAAGKWSRARFPRPGCRLRSASWPRRVSRLGRSRGASWVTWACCWIQQVLRLACRADGQLPARCRAAWAVALLLLGSAVQDCRRLLLGRLGGHDLAVEGGAYIRGPGSLLRWASRIAAAVGAPAATRACPTAMRHHRAPPVAARAATHPAAGRR